MYSYHVYMQLLREHTSLRKRQSNQEEPPLRTKRNKQTNDVQKPRSSNGSSNSRRKDSETTNNNETKKKKKRREEKTEIPKMVDQRSPPKPKTKLRVSARRKLPDRPDTPNARKKEKRKRGPCVSHFRFTYDEVDKLSILAQAYLPARKQASLSPSPLLLPKKKTRTPQKEDGCKAAQCIHLHTHISTQKLRCIHNIGYKV